MVLGRPGRLSGKARRQLIRAAHQIGWQNARPDGWRKTRGEDLTSSGAELPRFDDLDRPDLLAAFGALGCVSPAGMGGFIPLPFAELRAYGQATGRLSTPWEYETIRAMSEAYLAGLAEGRDLLSIMPIDRD